ncbi:hypothetical protein AVEN_144650-1 [Araneus ventricosus]|uniref:Uncharacterized protein n=1 Tax=Araneus ventricosus TaxID=182803 RepID=A0A4Y2DZF2_ARAVE|nr:hypothetical protein AVEN_144650-1 [Araneus ventricosus]
MMEHCKYRITMANGIMNQENGDEKLSGMGFSRVEIAKDLLQRALNHAYQTERRGSGLSKRNSYSYKTFSLLLFFCAVKPLGVGRDTAEREPDWIVRNVTTNQGNETLKKKQMRTSPELFASLW